MLYCKIIFDKKITYKRQSEINMRIENKVNHPIESSNKVLAQTIKKFIFIGLLISLCIFTFHIHCEYTKTVPPSEYSLTEIMQEVFLLIDIILYVIVAYKNKILKEASILAGCFTACMFVRELDFLFDFLARNSWKIIVTAIVIYSISATFLKKGLKVTFLFLANFTKHNGFNEIFHGMLMVLILSRFIGMNKLWSFGNVSNNDLYIYKRFIEKTLELCGYCLYTIGSALICLDSFK